MVSRRIITLMAPLLLALLVVRSVSQDTFDEIIQESPVVICAPPVLGLTISQEYHQNPRMHEDQAVPHDVQPISAILGDLSPAKGSTAKGTTAIANAGPTDEFVEESPDVLVSEGDDSDLGSPTEAVLTEWLWGRRRRSHPNGRRSAIWGTNYDIQIYFRQNLRSHWQHVGCCGKHISVSQDANDIWLTNVHDDIYHRRGRSGSWTHISGKLRDITTSYDGSLTYGINAAGHIFLRHFKLLEEASGLLRWIQVSGPHHYVAAESTPLRISVGGPNNDGNRVWMTDTVGRVFLKKGTSDWVRISYPGTHCIAISVNSRDAKHVWAIDKSRKIYYRNGDDGAWQGMDGEGGLEISVGWDGNDVWMTEKHPGKIQHRAGTSGVWNVIPGSLSYISVA
jgi:hypothetical protein